MRLNISLMTVINISFFICGLLAFLMQAYAFYFLMIMLFLLCVWLFYFYKLGFHQTDHAQYRVAQEDTFSANLVKKICHDLNTPLATMEITLSIIRDDIDATRYDLLNAAIQSMRNVSNNLVESYLPTCRIDGKNAY